MKFSSILLLLFALGLSPVFAQSYLPKIEPCPCNIKIEKGVIAKCGYLVVPENRKRPDKALIKIPFIFVRKEGMDSVRNISLYTTGGPGYSTTSGISGITANSGFLKYGGFIAFDQRGTKKAIPSLDCPEIEEAIQRSYVENLSRDSLVLLAVKASRKRISAQGIDLSSYTTTESAADINDLKLALKIQSLTLVGLSYSGGLMLKVAKNHPEGIKALVLNSPLPGFVNYEEHGLINMNEALEQIFANVIADSSKNERYKDLRNRFQEYFSNITGQRFTMKYLPKGKTESLMIRYGKAELLDAIIDRIDNSRLRSVPFVMDEIIKGNHSPYITEILNGVFSGDPGLSLGMRYSVYCSEQIAHSDPALIALQEKILPWFAGYPFNNVNAEICDCWKVKAEEKEAKAPVYSRIPALISGGDADPWCRPFYNTLIKRYLPNAQLLLIHNRAHGSGFSADGFDYMEEFMADPFKKLKSKSNNVSIQ